MNHSCTLIFVTLCDSKTLFILTFQNPLNTLIVILLLSFLTFHHRTMNLLPINPPYPDTSLNDTSSYKTINKFNDTNPSYTRIRHSTDSPSFPSHTDTSHKDTLNLIIN